MTTMLPFSRQHGLRVCGLLAALAMAAATLAAQAQAPRIQAEISSSDMSPLKGSVRPAMLAQYDAGRMPVDTKFEGMTLVFNRSAAQQADLDALLLAQQNPSSPLFHQWLTPEQFAARFGMAQSDLDKVQSWLEQQGFTVDSIARSRNMIHFSGTSGQIERAFQTEMHYYKINGEQHFAPLTALSVPSAMAGAVESVRDISDLRPKSMHIPANRMPKPKSDYTFWGTSNGTTEQFELFAPGDLRVVYDINPLLNAGTTGTGQTIAVMGQSQISTTDITTFQSVASLTQKAPTVILVPNTGTSAVSAGDEGESDLDLEWSGSVAPGANLVFVYTGNSANNNGVFDSISYAVDSKIGNIITVSYGSCELELQLANFSLDSTLQQAASQGQSVIASTGDTGSTACFGFTNLTLAQQQGLAVNYPASSQYVTGVGGTEITAANDGVGTYWESDGSSANSNILLTSALKYIPEVAWNDDAISGAATAQNGGGLSAGGGGASTLYTSKPSWQTGVPGIPNDGKRDVPDVALYSSPEYPGYLYCTSDQSDWNQGQTGSCVNGNFYDANGYFTVAGGTSFAAPIFAGMVALINQQAQYTAGQGLVNTELYKLASNSATYASAFHDVTTGNNYCTAGTANGFCSSSGATEGFAAGVGYDQVTGLGSVDLDALATAWAGNTSALIGTTTTVSAANLAPSINTADTITISVASTSGATIPTGTVSVSVNGGTASNFTLANGTYQDPLTFTTAGAYTIVAQYSGDATHSPSTGEVTVTVAGSSTGSGSFTMAATSVSVSQGSTGTSTITVTPAGGYKGTVDITPSSSTVSFCFSSTSAVVSGTSAVTTNMTIDTNLNDSICSSGAVRKGAPAGYRFFKANQTASIPAPKSPSIIAATLSLAGLLFAGIVGWRSRQLRLLACIVALAIVGFGLSACGGGGSPTNNNYTPKGTYTITLTGEDSSTATISGTTTFTLTVN